MGTYYYSPYTWSPNEFGCRRFRFEIEYNFEQIEVDTPLAQEMKVKERARAASVQFKEEALTKTTTCTKLATEEDERLRCVRCLVHEGCNQGQRRGAKYGFDTRSI